MILLKCVSLFMSYFIVITNIINSINTIENVKVENTLFFMKLTNKSKVATNDIIPRKVIVNSI